MSLEDFMSSGTLNTGRTANQETNQQQEKQEENKKSKTDEPYKVVGTDSRLAKVFPTKEDWDETLDVIQNEMDYTIDQVMNMESNKRHDVLHNAILKRNGSEGGEYAPTKRCIVCNEEFVFPSKWNFVRFKNEAVCKSHQVKVVMEEISRINSIDVNQWD
jgi:hypothetical protein